MSLKTFHIVFITLSILITFFFGTWLLVTVDAGAAVVRFIFGGLAYVAGLFLIVYARHILHKFQTLNSVEVGRLQK